MEPFIAQIIMFGGNFAPRNWALCDGQILPISQNTALFSILGTTYGGDGRTTFALPELRGRVAVHQGTGPGLNRVSLGQKGGNTTTTLSIANLPSHTHSTADLKVGVSSEDANSDDPAESVFGVGAEDAFVTQDADEVMRAGSVTGDIGNTGNNTSFTNMQPFQGVNYIIALVGTFPSRN